VDAEPRTGLRRTASKELVGGASGLDFEVRRPQLRQLPQATSKLDPRGERGPGGEGSRKDLELWKTPTTRRSSWVTIVDLRKSL
jgi:hypothetical protein